MSDVKSESEHFAPLSALEGFQVSTIFQDACNQLAILSRVGPFSYLDQPNAKSLVNENIDNASEAQNDVENKTGSKDRASHAKSVRDQMVKYSKTVNQNPLTSDNVKKMHSDLTFLQRVFESVRVETYKENKFDTLLHSVQMEKISKEKLLKVVKEEELLRLKIKQLQVQITETQKSKEEELQKRTELIARLKDQMQETKAKANMEAKYCKKLTDVAISQTQKRCLIAEDELEKEIDVSFIKRVLQKSIHLSFLQNVQHKIDKESSVNMEIEGYLKVTEKQLEGKVGLWRNKYNKELENMQIKLDQLKADQARDLDKLEKMTRTYDEYERIVTRDREEKERARIKAEKDAAQLRATAKIQAWWRSIAARRGLAMYRKGGAKKGGKKKGKGKKK